MDERKIVAAILASKLGDNPKRAVEMYLAALNELAAKQREEANALAGKLHG